MKQSVLGPSDGAHNFPQRLHESTAKGHHASRDSGLPVLLSHSVSSHKTTDSSQMSVYMPPDEEAPDGRIFLCFFFLFLVLHYHV